VGCGDNLAKCGYCQRFDDATLTCIQPVVGDIFEVSADAAPPCPYHIPRASLLTGRSWVWGFVGVALAAALFILGYALWMLREPSLPALTPQSDLGLSVEVATGAATVGRPLPVLLNIVNRSDRVVDKVRAELSRSFLREFVLEEVDPQVGYWQDFGEWRGLVLPPLEPRERRLVRLTLVPQRPGEFQLEVRLASEAGAYYGLALLPIRVRPSTAG
jgi:hypothetical protein